MNFKVSYKPKDGFYSMKNIITLLIPVLFTLFSCAQKKAGKI